MLENRQELRVSQELSPHLLTVVRLLQMDMAALSEYMLEMSEQNPALEYVPAVSARPAPRAFNRRRGADSDENWAALENIAQQRDPREELRRQARLLGLKPRAEYVCVAIIDSLDERGFFARETVEFASEFGVTPRQAEKCLRAVQSLDPAGVAARDLSERFIIQLRRAGYRDELAESIASDYLPDVLKRSYSRIAARTGASVAAVKRCVETISRLDPRPCDLSRDEAQYVAPDYEIEKDERGKLRVICRDEYYPSLKLDGDFKRCAAGLEGSDLSFVRRMTASARQIIRAVETRRITMEGILRLIVREQRGFFLGECPLMPLSCDDIARELGVHESTVYRCMAGKYLRCGGGTFPLSHFLQRSCGSLVSEAGAREIIRELCAEGANRSDREIAEMLERQGINLARRTIAKYRSQMSISSSYSRNAAAQERNAL